jgi:hypothetical protein
MSHKRTRPEDNNNAIDFNDLRLIVRDWANASCHVARSVEEIHSYFELCDRALAFIAELEEAYNQKSSSYKP